jgi:hypothetical protein
MFKTIEGVYHNGQIELSETPRDLRDNSRVIVTFLEPKSIDLHSRGLDARQIRELRARFSTIADDWDDPEMNLYDDYSVFRCINKQ